jgi:hypothetical protein
LCKKFSSSASLIFSILSRVSSNLCPIRGTEKCLSASPFVGAKILVQNTDITEFCMPICIHLARMPAVYKMDENEISDANI